jgi:hypothetical protein
MPNETKSKDESDNAERMEVWDVDKDLQEDPYRLGELEQAAMNF